MASARGNVVIRNSLRALFSERSVRATKGDAALMSRTPVVKLPGSPGMNCPTNAAVWLLPLSGNELLPAKVAPLV